MRIGLISTVGSLLGASVLAPMSAQAQTTDDRLAALEKIVAEQNRRIAELEGQLRAQSANPLALSSVTQVAAAPPAMKVSAAAAQGPAAPTAGSLGEPQWGIKGLDVTGDMRVRFEQNWSEVSPSRGRGVVRLRLGGTYEVNRTFSIGARLVTGDPDDPNTSDISLSGFDDDLAVALDQANVRARFGKLELTAGKIPQVFRKTELVWDDDVNPEGVSARFDVPLGETASATVRGLYFVVDENPAMADSRMIGAQAGLDLHPGKDWTVQISGAYYDYSLRSIAGGDSGDFGGNLRNAQGVYLSDFNIVDVMGSVRWTGLAQSWPVTITADLVHNGGAVADEGNGLALLASVGRLSTPGDWQLGYTYMRADADAVLAAFSHDNITLSTDYLLHGFAVDYVLRPNVRLNATYYRFHPQHSAILRGAIDQWSNRLRLNLLLGF